MLPKSTLRDLVTAIRKALEKIEETPEEACCETATAPAEGTSRIVAVLCICPGCGGAP